MQRAHCWTRLPRNWDGESGLGSLGKGPATDSRLAPAGAGLCCL